MNDLELIIISITFLSWNSAITTHSRTIWTNTAKEITHRTITVCQSGVGKNEI